MSQYTEIYGGKYVATSEFSALPADYQQALLRGGIAAFNALSAAKQEQYNLAVAASQEAADVTSADGIEQPVAPQDTGHDAAAAAEALNSMRSTAPELFNVDGTLNIGAALAHGIDPQFIVDSGGADVDAVNAAVDSYNVTVDQEIEAMGAAADRINAMSPPPVPDTEAAVPVETATEPDISLTTVVPGGQRISNDDLFTMSREQPELYKVLTTRGYDAYQSEAKRMAQAQSVELAGRYTRIPGGQYVDNETLGKMKLDQPELHRTLTTFGYDAYLGQAAAAESRYEGALTALAPYEIRSRVATMGPPGTAAITRSEGIDIAAALRGGVKDKTLLDAGFSQPVIDGARDAAVALYALAKYRDSKGNYDTVGMSADIRSGLLDYKFVEMAGVPLYAPDALATVSVIDTEARAGTAGFDAWRRSSSAANINPNSLVESARSVGVIRPWSTMTDSERKDYNRTGPNEAYPRNVGRWWLSLNDSDKSRIASNYHELGFSESVAHKLADFNAELEKATRGNPGASAVQMLGGAATAFTVLTVLGLPLMAGAIVERKGDVPGVVRDSAVGIADTAGIIIRGPGGTYPAAYGSALGTMAAIAKPGIGVAKGVVSAAKTPVRTVLYVTSKDGQLPRALKTPGNATYKYTDPKTGNTVTLQGNEWDVYRVPIPETITAAQMQRLVGQAQKLSIDTGKRVEVVDSSGILVREISPAGQVMPSVLYHADPNLVGLLNQSAGKGGVAQRGTAVIRDSRGRVLLTRIQGRNTYDLPGGEVDLALGELPVEGMFRELKEEVNLRPNQARYIGGFKDSEGGKYSPRQYHVYAVKVTGTPRVSAELAEIKWWDGKSKLDYPLTDFSAKALRLKDKGGPMEFSAGRKLVQQKLSKEWELLPLRYKAKEMALGATAKEVRRAGLDAPAKDHYIRLSRDFYYSPDVAFDFARKSSSGLPPKSPGVIALKLSQKDIDLISPELRSQAISTPLKQWMAAVEDELTQRGVKIYDTGVETKTWYPGVTESTKGYRIKQGQRMPVRWFMTENAFREGLMPPTLGQLQAANLLALKSSIADILHLRLRRISLSGDRSAGTARPLLRVDRQVYKYSKSEIGKLASELEKQKDFSKRASALTAEIAKLSEEERRLLNEFYYVDLAGLLRLLTVPASRSGGNPGEVIIPVPELAGRVAAQPVERYSAVADSSSHDTEVILGRTTDAERIGSPDEMRAALISDREAQRVSTSDFRVADLRSAEPEEPHSVTSSRIPEVLRSTELTRIGALRPPETPRPPRPPETPRPPRPPETPLAPSIVTLDSGAVSSPQYSVPDGSITWKGGAFWKYIPPPWTAPKPHSLRRPPIGALNTGGRTPAETIQMIGRSGTRVPESIVVDLGVADIRVSDYGRHIVFTGRGEQTDVSNDGSNTQGMEILADAAGNELPGVLMAAAKGNRRRGRPSTLDLRAVRQRRAAPDPSVGVFRA